MSETALATVQQKPDVQSLLAKVGDKRLSFGARLNSVGDVMKAMSSKMMAALPKHVTADRMIRVAINCIRKTPKLLDCDPASLFGAITEAATYGWELGGVLGHAYLVPFKRECQLIPGYKGLIDLCRRSGQVSTISLEVVHEGDVFDYSIGDTPYIKHKPDDRNPKRHEKPITHAYAVVRLKDGGIQRSVWSSEQIDAHKEQYSSGWRFAEHGPKEKGGSKKDSPWHTAWPTMAKKTVIRDMIQRGLVPVSPEYRDMIQRGIQDDDEGIDIEAIDIVPVVADELAIEGEAGERPETGDEPNQDLIELARMDIAAAVDDPGIDFAADELLAKAEDEATRTAINGLRRDRKAALAAASNPKKQQKDLVK